MSDTDTKNDLPAMTVMVALPDGSELFVEVQPETLAADGMPNKATVRVYRLVGDERRGIATTIATPDGASIDPKRVANAMKDGIVHFADIYAKTADGKTVGGSSQFLN